MVARSSHAPAGPSSVNDPLAQVLDALTVPGTLARTENDRVRCLACGHRCLLAEGRRGACRVRFNRGGTLQVPFGYVAGLQADPVEKKPFHHVYPGATALTFGMLGCDFHCAYCQNWLTSQALRDPAAGASVHPLPPEEIVAVARQHGARLVVSSYNEPLITAEWSDAIFRLAGPAGLACAVVSNGNATREALDLLGPHLTACKIDLKGFDALRYRTLGGTLDNVLATLRDVHRRGVWLEVVTLVVPGFNDDESELHDAASFLASLSPDIPWHVTAFHPDYRMTAVPRTMLRQLVRVAEQGVAAGLRYVYVGNLPGRVGPWEDTWCPHCRTRLVARQGWQIRAYHLTPDGRCPQCHAAIPGLWAPPPP